MRRLRKFASLVVFVLGIVVVGHRAWAGLPDDSLISWLKANTSKDTGLPLSFQLPADPAARQKIWDAMGPYTTKTANANSVDGIIERVIVNEGLDIYDGACWQIALSATGRPENLALALKPIQAYWAGYLKALNYIRAGKGGSDQPFIYNPEDPKAVSAGTSEAEGVRGFIFRIFDAHGRYATADPLDGKTRFQGFPVWPVIHLEDWKPIAGENAWVVMAALQRYYGKYYDTASNGYKVPSQDLITYTPEKTRKEAIELALSQELARCALLLQADNGGIRMAPIGTYNPNGQDFYYNEISTENNCSWHAAFSMLYSITGNRQYKNAVDGIERYLKSSWDAKSNVFYQGMHFTNGKWQTSEQYFAVDCQTWAICVLGPEKIDSWFGEGAAYQMWQKTKQLADYRAPQGAAQGKLLGLGYTSEHDRMSIEWTAGAVLACRILSDYYKTNHADWSAQAADDAQSMRVGIESFRYQVSVDQAGYSYSSRRGAIPFGWNSHDPAVLSTTSTAWVYFLDTAFNPFQLGGTATPPPPAPAIRWSISWQAQTRYPVLTIIRNDPAITQVRIYYSDNLSSWSSLPIIVTLTGDKTLWVDDGTVTGSGSLPAQRYYRLTYTAPTPSVSLKAHFTSPVIVDLNRDGVFEILVGSDGKKVVALNQYGDVSWRSVEGITDVIGIPTVAKDNQNGGFKIAMASKDGVRCLDEQGHILWKYPLLSSLQGSPVLVDINGDGALETLIGSNDGTFYCLDKTGQLLWRYAAGAALVASPVVADLDGNGSLEVIFGLGSKDRSVQTYCYCLDAQGNLIWKSFTGNSIKGIMAADINADGALEVLVTLDDSWDGVLSCLNKDGKLLWTVDRALGGFPAVGDVNGDGKLEIFMGSGDGNLYCFDSNGQVIWKYYTRHSLEASVVIADINKDGNLEILFHSGGLLSLQSQVYCLNKNGTLLWKYDPLPAALIKGLSFADLDGDGNTEILFVADYFAPRNYSELVCLNNKGEIFTPAKTQGVIDPLAWPMFQHDLQHTGLYDFTPPVTPRVRVAQSTYATSQLYASFVSQDKESGVLEYRYRITAGSKFGPLVRNWTSVRGAAYVTAGALRLTKGRTYYFTVQAKNNLGLWSLPGYSDGITVNAIRRPPGRYSELRN